ncbi:SanA/YdcF family protein [Nocardiopsis halophila]|uniref:SanA/YdcF family protein n=1 Tax=Nocardiopsis halophila TaxID=141692 RepID=UPI000345502B|nr:ElyC/SanA/YdcF family protein [Nocardiopsis halophila]
MGAAKRAALAAGSAAAAALGPTAWAHASALGRRFGPEDVPVRPVALVLGAGMKPHGPSLLLARRLDLAALLHRTGRVRAVLVSGDNREASGCETDGMSAYLVAAGVPAACIAADPYGFRTWDSFVRARDVYGINSATVVTQGFHLPRALALAAAAGIDAVGVGDDSWRARPRATALGHVREIGANARALSDALSRPAPFRTCSPRDDVRDALLAAEGHRVAPEVGGRG